MPAKEAALKPCPMCKRPPSEVNLDGPAPYEIVCDRIAPPRAGHCVMVFARTKRGAIAAWNRRAS